MGLFSFGLTLGSLRPAQLDEWIERLFSTQIDDNFLLYRHEVQRLCQAATRTLLEHDATLLKLEPAHWVCVGDIHGQFHDLIGIFKHFGMPPATKYLFLGDYVDRGPRSLEVMSLLLALKLRWPDSIYLLRGNHECAIVTSMFGFRYECMRRCGEGVWEDFVNVFNVLPVGAVIGPPTSTLCVHGGISPSMQHLDEIEEKIKRPVELSPNSNCILTDMLWSDPCADIDTWAVSLRGTSYRYGIMAVRNFMRMNGLKRIVRGHTAENKGYNVMGSKHEVVTVFSAPNYKDLPGDGAVLLLEPDGSYHIKLMQHTKQDCLH